MKLTQNVTENSFATDPVELRSIFGDNLRLLAADYASIAGLCRELGINRTQFNRYLTGESFPRPDVLHRICVFFGVDARVLLERVDTIMAKPNDLLSHSVIKEFLGNGSVHVPENDFPSGLYRFSRPSFMDDNVFVYGLIQVFRENDYTFLRGYEPKEAMRMQGLRTDAASREFRGIVLRQEQGIAALVARHRAMTCSFNFLSPVMSYDNNFWEGYASRTVRENLNSRRAARMVYEHLPNNRRAVFETARLGGLCRLEDLPVFHRRMLRLDEPFR